jgi:hypothetical protein
MAAPLGISIAFDDLATEPNPTWTRIDDQSSFPDLSVQSWSIDRGRASELDQTKTGTATVRIIDKNGILDPTNTGSPFYPLVVPMLHFAIALQHPITSAWVTLFRGYVNEWLYDLDPTEHYATVTIEASDAFDFLSALELTPTVHGTTPPDRFNSDQVYFEGEPSTFKHVNQRIQDVLDDAGWPADLEDIFSGNVTVQEKIYERRDQILSALQDAADAEFPGVANVYVSKDGKIRFRGRFARFNPTHPGYGIGSWSCGDLTTVSGSTAIAPISAPFNYRTSNLDIYNGVLALPYGVDELDVPGNFVEDSTSISFYGFRGLSFPDLLTYKGHTDLSSNVSAVDETKKFATYYVDNYATPKTRVTLLTFRPRGTSSTNARALWDLICGVEIGDLIHVKTSHTGGGGFDTDYFIEGVRYEAVPMNATFPEITLSCDLSPRSYFNSNPFGTVDDGG